MKRLRKGYNKLSCWFGLSYASWLVIPRVLMEAMPDKWQEKMAKLLEELDDTYPNMPNIGYRVSITEHMNGGKFIKMPKWLGNYRYPNKKEIEKVKNR